MSNRLLDLILDTKMGLRYQWRWERPRLISFSPHPFEDPEPLRIYPVTFFSFLHYAIVCMAVSPPWLSRAISHLRQMAENHSCRKKSVNFIVHHFCFRTVLNTAGDKLVDPID